MKDRWRRLALALFFGMQLLGIVRSRFADDRYFAWAPLHEVTVFEAYVTDASGRLDREAVATRYALPDSSFTADGRFRELNAIGPLLRRIERIECARRPRASVRLALETNGRPRSWTPRCQP